MNFHSTNSVRSVSAICLHRNEYYAMLHLSRRSDCERWNLFAERQTLLIPKRRASVKAECREMRQATAKLSGILRGLPLAKVALGASDPIGCRDFPAKSSRPKFPARVSPLVSFLAFHSLPAPSRRWRTPANAHRLERNQERKQSTCFGRSHDLCYLFFQQRNAITFDR